MASTYSDQLRLELMANGEQDTTWGTKTNTNLELIEASVSGLTTFAVTIADVTLTASNATDDQSRHMVLVTTGALTGNRAVIVPTKTKLYLVKNDCTGAYTLTVKTVAGTGVVVLPGHSAWVYCDGTNVLAGGVNRDAVPLSMDTVSGLIVSRTGNDTWAVTIGACRDSTDTYNIRLATALTAKTVSGAWAAGSSTGGRTGAAEAASTAMHCFLIYKPADGTVDALIDNSYTSPTLPSGYTHYRFIRTLFNDSSSHLNLDAHSGDYVHLDAPLSVVSDSTITSATYETATLPVPPHAICMLQFRTGDTGVKADWRTGLKKGGAALPTAANGWSNTQQIPNVTAGVSLEPGGKGLVQVSATSTIAYGVQTEATTADVEIYLMGFFMPTRRNPSL